MQSGVTTGSPDAPPPGGPAYGAGASCSSCSRRSAAPSAADSAPDRVPVAAATRPGPLRSRPRPRPVPHRSRAADPPRPTMRSPEQAFGFACGADQKFIGWQPIVDYFHDATKRVPDRRPRRGDREEHARAARSSWRTSRRRRTSRGSQEIRDYNRRVALGEADLAEIRSGRFPATVLVTAGIHATEFTGHAGDARAPLAARRRRGAGPDSLLARLPARARPVVQPGRPRDREGLVREDARHAVRGDVAARALPPLRRPRQQPRRVHADAGRVAAT